MKKQQYNPADYPVHSYGTFPDFLSDLENRFGSRLALSWFTRRKEEKTLTYSELLGKVRALRSVILRKQYSQGTHMAIVSENSADWIITALAVISCGHVAVCVDVEQSDSSIRSMITRSDSKLVFLSQTFLPICQPLLDSNDVSDLILMGFSSPDPRISSLDALYELGAQMNDCFSVPISPDSTAEIVFTSGTTSLSKMVMLSQKAILQNICDATSRVNLQDRVFCSLPFYHAYGFNCAVLNSFLQGAHLYINGNIKTTMRDLQLAQPNCTLTVPLMLEAIHNQVWMAAEKNGQANSLRMLMRIAAFCRKMHIPIRFKAFDTLRENISSSLRLIICGGAHLSKELSEEFELWGIQVLQGYGITECSPLISVNGNCANRLGTVGPVLPSLEIRLEGDEIYVRGPSVMQGYYNNPAETAEALTEDGWFRTGDLGSVDKDGFLSLSGRKKNLIVFKNGKKISPEKLESLILSIPLVKEVIVSGTASGSFADDVKLTASIYPNPQQTDGMSSYEILERLQHEMDKINATLPAYQQIQLINIREKEFSKTGTKKIKRYDD